MAAGDLYSDVRWWAVWLDTFTERDMASSLGMALEIGQWACRALVQQGIVEYTGDGFEGPEGWERIYSYVPLPPGPRWRPRQVPVEIEARLQAGGDPLKQPRGLPVSGMTGGQSMRARRQSERFAVRRKALGR